MRLVFSIPSSDSIVQFGLFIGRLSLYFRIRGPAPYRYWRSMGMKYSIWKKLKGLVIIRFEIMDSSHDWGVKIIA